jgi:chromate transport protein ChrA
MPVTPPRSLTELFLGFLSIGARSFGGVMPWAHRVIVEERRWMSAEEFTVAIGLCQFLPGPNVGNASIVLGRKWFGVRGSIVAFAGLSPIVANSIWRVPGLAAVFASQAICLLSCDHTARQCSPGAFVSWVGVPPAVGTT